MRRALLALVLVAGVTFGFAQPASAHAVLETTTPVDRAHLDQAPSVVTLQFSENVSAEVGAVKVYDGNGTQVDNGNLEVRNNVVTLGLQSGRPDSAYIVTYRVISADSHPVRGAFTFTVGNATAASDSAVAKALDSGTDDAYEILAAVARFIAYSGVLLAAGGALFLVLAHDGGDERHLLLEVVTTAGTVGLVGLLAEIPAQAALATGLGTDAVTDSEALRGALANGLGSSTLVGVLGTAAVLIAVRFASSAPARAIVVVGAAAAAGSFALTGHSRNSSPAVLIAVTDLAHLWAAATWFGGIVLLALMLRARRVSDAERDNAVATGRVVTRFSRVATVAVLAVGVTGFTLAWAEVRALKALTSTGYGQLLIAKMAVVGLIAALGVYNHFRLVPAIETAPKKAGTALRRTVGVEALLMVAVLGLTSVLVNTIPARDAAGLSGVFSATVPMGEGSVNLVVDPNRAGQNSVHLYLLDSAGRNRDVQSLSLSFTMPANDIGPIERDAYLAGQGHYQVDSSDLSIPGDWIITVKARVDKFTAETADVPVTVNP